MNETRNETNPLARHLARDSPDGLTFRLEGGKSEGTVHEICEEIRPAAVASAGQSGPDCCTAVIYLHTAVHRLWLTSQALHRCLRSQ